MRAGRKTGIAATAAILALAAALIGRYEGTRYAAYQDTPGRWTICEGHTRGVHEGMTANATQCVAWREQDLREADAAIGRCIHAPLTAGQHAALLDAVYNVGPAIVCGSTLQRLANAGQPWCAQLKRWVYAGGKKLAGLVSRRETEYRLCVYRSSVIPNKCRECSLKSS